jgi:hypothetical protein
MDDGGMGGMMESNDESSINSQGNMMEERCNRPRWSSAGSFRMNARAAVDTAAAAARHMPVANNNDNS